MNPSFAGSIQTTSSIRANTALPARLMRFPCLSRQLLFVPVTHFQSLAAQRKAAQSIVERAYPFPFVHSTPLHTLALPHSNFGIKYGRHRQRTASTPVGKPRPHNFRSGATLATSTMPAQLPAGEVFFLDEFAVRQWDSVNCSGTQIDHDKADFVARWGWLARHLHFKDATKKSSQCSEAAHEAPFRPL